MGSPHKLAWYWLQVLEKLTKEQVMLWRIKYYSSLSLLYILPLKQHVYSYHPQAVCWYFVFVCVNIQNTNLCLNQKDHVKNVLSQRKQYCVVKLQCDTITVLVYSPLQVPPHIRRELEFLLLLEELGSEGVPETVLKVIIILTFLCNQI